MTRDEFLRKFQPRATVGGPAFLEVTHRGEPVVWKLWAGRNADYIATAPVFEDATKTSLPVGYYLRLKAKSWNPVFRRRHGYQGLEDHNVGRSWATNYYGKTNELAVTEAKLWLHDQEARTLQLREYDRFGAELARIANAQQMLTDEQFDDFIVLAVAIDAGEAPYFKRARATRDGRQYAEEVIRYFGRRGQYLR